jgi:hypothetical protein
VPLDDTSWSKVFRPFFTCSCVFYSSLSPKRHLNLIIKRSATAMNAQLTICGGHGGRVAFVSSNKGHNVQQVRGLNRAARIEVVYGDMSVVNRSIPVQ